MAKNQVYLIKSGQNSFIEETEAIIGISGGRIGVGTTAPESDFHITGNTQIDGDLTVRGNFSTINETSVQVDDKNIELGVVDVPTDITADGGGITLRGATNKTISWLGSNAAWNFNQDVRVDSGKLFKGEKVEAINSLGLGLLNESGSGVFLKSSNIGINLDLDVSGSGNFSQGLYVNGEAVVTGSAGKWYDGNVVGQIFYTGGNVGVNSDSPVYDLDVSGSGNFSQGLYVNGEAVVTGSAGKWYDGNVVGQIFYTGGNVGVNSDSPVYDLDVSGSGNFSQGLYVDGNAVLTGISSSSLGKWQDGNEAGEIFYDAGKVGVGTDNPEYDLHVDGNTYIEGSLNVSSEFKVGSNGAVGDTQPVQDGDIVKWDLANSKWSVGSNIPGGLVTGEVPLGFIKPLASGSSIYQVDFVEEYDAIPSISTDLQIEGDGDIIPYVISGVSASSYNLVFAKNLPNNNYRIHTTFGGRPVYWKTGSDASVNYTEGDVNILRDLTVSGNLTVDGTQLIVNTETIKLEDHNIEIAANAGYDTISDAGISWGTGIAGVASPVSLTYSNGQGFNFAGGNVGIGTTSPSAKFEVKAPTMSLFRGINDVGLSNGIQFKFGDSASTAIAQSYASIGGVIKNNTAGAHNGELAFSTAKNGNLTTAEERMRIDSDGNVGIGTTNPEFNLSIEDSSDAIIQLKGSQLGRVYFGDAADNNIGRIQYYHVNNSMQFWTNSAEKMRIDANGNVGIGTSTPGAKLDVIGRIKSDSIVGNNSLSIASGGTGNLNLYHGSFGTTAELALSIASGGYVGIGTTNPGNILNIYDSAAGSAGTSANPDWSDSLFLQRNIPNNYQGTRILFAHGKASIGGFREDHTEDGSHHLVFYTGANLSGVSEAMRINSTGNVGIGTTSPNTEISAVATVLQVENSNLPLIKIKHSSSGSSEFYKNGSGALCFAQNEVEAMRINASGNVGIGTTSPFAKLHLRGGNTVDSADVEDQLIFHRGFNSGVIDSRFGALSFGTVGNLGHAGRLDFKLSTPYAQPGSNPTDIGAVATVMSLNGEGNVGIGTYES